VPAEHPERPFEVPQHLNVRHGVFIVENLDLSALAGAGVREFALILTHPRLLDLTHRPRLRRQRWITTTSSSSAPARAAGRSPTASPRPASASCCSSA